MSFVTGLDHVQIEAPAGCEAQARAFFGTFLGLPERVKPEALRRNGGVWFGLPDGWQQPVGVTPEVVPRGKGHPGLRCADLAAFTAHGVRHGVPYRADREAGVARVFLTDPFGKRLEVVPRGHPGVRRAAGGSRNREFTRLTGPSGRMVR
ncbi:glyoxalase [Deinococcus actinosclerus]|uniref:glyoxalase n=1 Tax=Deinococcus actinosclerus TaxID=1768108 RepID=UPI0009EB0D7F|nr:glyoxalase [Deinococcus actinosclerus]